MKRQIRLGAFETNSSSTHAICITKGDYKLKKHIDFAIGEFGWECITYKSLYERASYLITAILSANKDKADENLQKLKNILDDHNVEYVLPKLKVASYKYHGKDFYYYDINGYLDHAAEANEFINDVLADSDKLFRYLFGDSMVITGNDNSDEFNDRMRINEGEEKASWGTYTNYGDLKQEFDNYEVYIKGN